MVSEQLESFLAKCRLRDRGLASAEAQLRSVGAAGDSVSVAVGREDLQRLRVALVAARKRYLFLALDVDRGKAKGPADALMAKFDKCVSKALKGES